MPCHSSPGNCSGVRCASRSNCSAGISRCSISVKSLPNGNDGSSPASRAGFNAAAIRSGKFSRCAARNFKTPSAACRHPSRLRQFVLKARIRDRQHRRDRLGVGFSADIGDAVFGDEDIAQMPRNGLVAVVPADVGLRLCAGLPRRFQRQDRARALQRKSLRHEIVLAADAAHDLAVIETVGDRSPHQRRHHRIVDEARIDARAALGVLVAIKLVGERHRHHLDARELLRRHLAQACCRTISARGRTRRAASRHRPRA